jgi:hypothetical protein
MQVAVMRTNRLMVVTAPIDLIMVPNRNDERRLSFVVGASVSIDQKKTWFGSYYCRKSHDNDFAKW